jgi:hypothetical protein
MRPPVFWMQFAMVSHAPQYISPEGQQWPPLHVPPHVALHAPQLPGLMFSSTHSLLHSEVPPKH